ncbi:type II toxin-antitoxin system RelE/ParE family toxin [Methanosalsum natronophilum]|uniref:Type II toxin-antitoxin system RelE/ParE family toxin n=1 Tax=Methanosalsum natronophilum TaxID=768733 RepID=A0A3R7YIN1_9EURY|nr:MAG: type II toxin-antitoxin system RelE/ParE family toxin [Methanosalsum natronophilum]
MNYQGLFTNAFKKDLKSIQRKHQLDLKKIIDAIEDIILVDPYSADLKQLACFNYYRYRVGDYRIVFDIENETDIIFLAVDMRFTIYNKLRNRMNKC